MPERADKSDQQKDAEFKVKSFQANLGPFVVATETNSNGDGVYRRNRAR